jgi:hypothetical protein
VHLGNLGLFKLEVGTLESDGGLVTVGKMFTKLSTVQIPNTTSPWRVAADALPEFDFHRMQHGFSAALPSPSVIIFL